MTRIRREILPQPFVYKRMEEIEQHNPAKQEKPHRHDYYTLIFVKAAKGVHHIDFKDYPLTAHTFYLLSPEQVHHMEVEGIPSGEVFLFTPDFLQYYSMPLEQLVQLDLFYNCAEAPPIQIPEAKLAEVKTVLQIIAQEDQHKEWNYLQVIGAQVKHLFYLLKRIKAKTQSQQSFVPSRKAMIVQQFKRDLERSFRTNHKVSEYAGLQSLSSIYLNEVIKAETGSTAKEMIQQRILLEAKRLAKYTDWSMKEVAYSLGFEDNAHFSKLFKKLEGSNFSSFRNA